VRSERDRFPQLASASTTDAAYLEMVERKVPERAIATCEIPIPLVTLVPGRYELTMVARGSTDTIAMRFQIVWEMMPFSLRTLDYAINALEYICTEGQIDSLSDGSPAENREHLMSWWRAQDPTPATTVNERMNEYYRRVDNAYFGFSSIAEPDGARTDRGKVYILYGPPATVEKDLKGKAPREIWTYTAGIKKTFVFEANDSGRLKLVDVR
jgi:GWxTD domain-containing protein